MRYIPLTDQDKKEMLDTIGISSISDLFNTIPVGVKSKNGLKIPAGSSEEKTFNQLKNLASQNIPASEGGTFLGAGSYNHFIPSVVDHITGRSEWYSAYTPYQPEVSQGTLQAIYEFQSYICDLFGMEIANASMYDGGSALGEAALMATRVSKKNEIIISNLVHPRWREITGTFTKNREINLKELKDDALGKVDPVKIAEAITENSAAVIVQSPNFFGCIEDLESIGKVCKEKNVLFIVGVAEALSLGMLKPPGEFGADIVVGEGQSLGLPQSFGGPYLGLFATKQKYMRQMPGRLCGRTLDTEGRNAFVLTMAAREQHIRREKATSNICTNQALCALRTTIYLSLLGKTGIARMAKANFDAGAELERLISKSKKIKMLFKHPFFNETVVELKRDVEKVNEKLAKKGITGGLDLSRFYPDYKKAMLIAVTELTTKEQMANFVKGLEG